MENEIVRVEGLAALWPEEPITSVMEALAAEHKLPADFQFRLFMLDEEERATVATQDILAAMGHGEGSGHSYLTDELPDCMWMGYYTRNINHILGTLSVDYYKRSDLAHVGSEITPRHVARSAWDIYVKQLDPELHQRLTAPDVHDDSKARYVNRCIANLGKVIIRDEALLDLYHSEESLEGHGNVKRELLHYLLLDNHPELGA